MSSLDTPLQSSLNCVDTNKILTGLYIAAVHILDSTHNTVNQEQNTGLHADTYVNIAEQQCMNHCYMQKQRETQTHTAEPKQSMKVYVLHDYNNETQNTKITLWQ